LLLLSEGFTLKTKTIRIVRDRHSALQVAPEQISSLVILGGFAALQWKINGANQLQRDIMTLRTEVSKLEAQTLSDPEMRPFRDRARDELKNLENRLLSARELVRIPGADVQVRLPNLVPSDDSNGDSATNPPEEKKADTQQEVALFGMFVRYTASFAVVIALGYALLILSEDPMSTSSGLAPPLLELNRLSI
jgi:hypothetical protein